MIAERINHWLATVRAAHATAVLARLVILAAGLLSLIVLTGRPWDLPDVIWYAGLPLLVISATVPDSASPLLFVATVATGWLTAGDGVEMAVAVIACCLVVFHLAAAYAGQVPSYAVPGPGVVARWLLPATVAGAVAWIAAALSAAVNGQPGSLGVTVAALAGIGAVAWFVSRPEASEVSDASDGEPAEDGPGQVAKAGHDGS